MALSTRRGQFVGAIGAQALTEAGMSRIECDICGKEIRSGSDLFVVAHWGILVRPYCAGCYAGREKPYWHHSRTGSISLNSNRMTWGLATSLAMWLVVIFIIQGRPDRWVLVVVGVAVAWSAILRVYSYFRYERNLA